MDINSIKLGKGIQKKNQKDVNQEKPVVVVDDRSSADRTAAEKIRSKAISYYAAAMLGLTGAGLTSCGDITQEQINNNDNSETLKLLQQMMSIQQELLEIQKQVLEQLQQNSSDNKELIDLNKQLIEQNNQILEILTQIGADVNQISSAIYKIQALLEETNANDAEFLNKIQEIIDQQISDSEKLEQILEANKEQNKMLTNLTTLISTVGGDLSETLKAFYEEYKNARAEDEDDKNAHSEMLENIYNALITSNEISTENNKAIKDLYNQMVAGQISESEMLGKITQLLESIDSKLDGLKDAITNMGTGNEELAAILQAFYEDYKSGTITSNALLSKILEALDKANENNGDIAGKLDKISQQIADGSISLGEALGQITDILNSINNNTAAILDKIGQISGQIDKLSGQLQVNHDESMDMLANINNGVGSIDQKLDNVIANQEIANQKLTEISQKSDEMIAQLSQINDKTITIDQMKELLGPMFETIYNKMDNIAGNQIDIDEIKNAIAENKTDLTKTNALIETLTTVVQKLNLGDGMTEELKLITQAIKDFQAQSGANDAEQIKGLQDILAELAQIKTNQTTQTDVLNAILDAAKQIKDNQDKFMTTATTFGNKLFEELNKISSNMIDKNAFEVYADSYREQLAKAEQTRQEQLAVLQAILENQGAANGGLTIEELKEIIPDYNDILNQISEQIGNLVTKVDLIDFGNNNKVDLTKTNALIETLTTVVQKLPIGGGSSSSGNSEELKTIAQAVSQILDQINSKNSPSTDQMNQLIDAVNKIVENTTASTEQPDTRMAYASNDRTYKVSLFEIQKAYEQSMHNA